MTDFLRSAETNIHPPTTEEMLLKYGNLDLALQEDRAIYRAALCSQGIQPDTPEQAEERAKAVFQAQVDFRLQWDKHTEELAAQRPKSPAEIIPITKHHPQLDSFAGRTAIHRWAS